MLDTRSAISLAPCSTVSASIPRSCEMTNNSESLSRSANSIQTDFAGNAANDSLMDRSRITDSVAALNSPMRVSLSSRARV